MRPLPYLHILLACAAVLTGAGAATAQPTATDMDAALAKIGATTAREVASDIALPADSAEYEALGKNAVLMLDASSVLASELPLRSAYVMVGDVRVPLQRVLVLPAKPERRTRAGRPETYTRQVAFYLVPIYLLQRESHLKVDFTGRRDGFGVSRFQTGGLAEAPTFIRGDDYGFPAEPDMAAVRALVVREFAEALGLARAP